MTERFKHTRNAIGMQFISYDEKEILIGTFADADGVTNIVKLLNELHEDNQLLHKMNAEAIDFMYDNFDLNIIFTDRDLNNICNEMGWELSEKGIKIDQLKKENEQLKEALFFYLSVAITETSSHINEDLEKECNQLLKCSYKEALEKYDTSKYE